MDLRRLGAGVRGAIVRHAELRGDRFLVEIEFFHPLSLAEVEQLANA